MKTEGLVNIGDTKKKSFLNRGNFRNIVICVTAFAIRSYG